MNSDPRRIHRPLENRTPESPAQVDGQSRPRILIVEDEQLVALDLKRRVEAFGYEVAGTATSGEEAIAMAHLVNPSLVLLDFRLAGQMDGADVAEQLNQDLGAPFIFITGNSDTATLARMSSAHPGSTIVKPVRDRELKMSIESVLHHDGLRRQLDEAREQLEARVLERTRELAQANRRLVDQLAEHVRMEAQLREAKAISEAAARSRTGFFANISRQIRTPMNGIVGMSEVLRMTELTEEQREHLATVTRCAAALLNTIDQVIALAELESGHVELSSSPVRLREEMPRLLQPLAAQAREKGIELTCDLSPEIAAVVYTDRGRLEQLISQLIGYCLATMRPGRLELHCDALSRATDRTHLHFSLRDSTRELSTEEQHEIQDLFDQPDTHTREMDHPMFGLVIPALIVPRMPGILWVETLPGHGTTYHCSLWLPVGRSEQANTGGRP